MPSPISSSLTQSLPLPLAEAATPQIDLRELQTELDELAHEVHRAQSLGIPLPKAVRSPEFPELALFHQGLRDALFLEIPSEIEGFVHSLQGGTASGAALGKLQRTLVDLAQGEDEGDEDEHRVELRMALAEFLVFEAIRLRLLITTLSSEDFEQVGGEEEDIDAIAWSEVQALLYEPVLDDPEIRPFEVMHASASVAIARDAAFRANLLREAGEDFREELRMRARLRGALRELRLPEAVLLENALASLLGDERKELTELQADRPVALDGLSRQAMDQRVSRGRRALSSPDRRWPRRRRPSLFDLLRQPGAAA
ncbi:MAG: hypothetical protein KC636_05695 [Myxococcales bacterium]|nr:hypothetical protein [Myxococcales bacterium]